MQATALNRIARGVAALEASHMECAGQLLLNAGALPPGIGLVRILGLERFWQDEQHALTSLEERQVSMVRGMAEAGLPWAYALVGNGEGVEVYLGLTGGQAACGEWEGPLQAILPGSRWEQGPTPLALMQDMAPSSIAAALTGNPAHPTLQVQEGGLPPRGQLESIVRGMMGSRWAYLVMATPVSPESVENGLQLLMGERQEIASAYMRPGTAEADNHPAAQHYMELLDAAWEHYEDGRSNGMWDVTALLLAEDATALSRMARLTTSVLGSSDCRPQPLRIQPCVISARGAETDLPLTRLSTTEAVSLTRLLSEDFPGYRVWDHAGYAASGPVLAPGTPSIGLGKMRSHGAGAEVRIARDALCKHTFVTGTTGSGKTRTCQVLLAELWEEHRVPWLVIEPAAKTDYRQLLAGPFGQDIHVLTLGNEAGAPFRLNPLEVMPGVHVQRHIDGVVALFTAAFSWVTPMPYVLAEALYRIYQQFGWDVTTGTNARGYGVETQPAVADLLAVVPSVVAELGYGREISGNLRAGVETRLRSLTFGAKGAMLNTSLSTPMDWLMRHPTILEFESLGDDETKAFIMAALLLRLAEYHETHTMHEPGLRHVTVLEEAHRLLRAAPESLDSEIAHPRGKAIELFTNLLAEIRAAGEGLIVVDQAPKKLAQDVLRNTGTKIAHRIVEGDDRRALADAMNLSESQTRKLGALQVGTGMLYQEGEESPCLLQVDDRAMAGTNARVSDEAVRTHMLSRVPVMPTRPSQPRQSVTAVVGNCPGCDGACAHRDRALRVLLDNDLSEPFQEALQDEWGGLWQFGMRIAHSQATSRSDAPPLAYCLLMQLIAATGLPEELQQRARRNLTILRQRTQDEGGNSHGDQ